MSSSPPATEPTALGHVEIQIAEGVATVRFGHPKGNSLPGALLRRLADEVAALGRRADVRVIVMRSDAPGPFCAGASFDELRGIGDAAAGKDFFMGFARLILAMRGCPQLVVARVHGRTVGGGVGIVAASDYAVAHASASLKLSELAVGIGPFVVGPVIERKIGTGPFGALAIDAGWRDAAWGERHGLYARVVESPEELDEAVATLARTLAQSNPEATARIKAALWQGTEHWPALLEERAAMSGSLVLSDFTRQALAAFAAR